MSTLIDFKGGLKVLDPDPSGAGGAAIQDNFVQLGCLAMYLATTDPVPTDDADADFVVGSLWFNSSSLVAFVCTDNAARRATWAKISGGTAADLAAHIAATAAHGATGAVVGTTNTQTLTNKTISGTSNTFTNIPDAALSANVALLNASNSFVPSQTFKDTIAVQIDPSSTEQRLLQATNSADSVEYVRLSIDQYGNPFLHFGNMDWLEIRSGTGLGASRFRVLPNGTSVSATFDATQYTVNGTQVLTSQQAAIADATNSSDVVTQFNALLAALRAHGLIAT